MAQEVTYDDYLKIYRDMTKQDILGYLDEQLDDPSLNLYIGAALWHHQLGTPVLDLEMHEKPVTPTTPAAGAPVGLIPVTPGTYRLQLERGEADEHNPMFPSYALSRKQLNAIADRNQIDIRGKQNITKQKLLNYIIEVTNARQTDPQYAKIKSKTPAAKTGKDAKEPKNVDYNKKIVSIVKRSEAPEISMAVLRELASALEYNDVDQYKSKKDLYAYIRQELFDEFAKLMQTTSGEEVLELAKSGKLPNLLENEDQPTAPVQTKPAEPALMTIKTGPPAPRPAVKPIIPALPNVSTKPSTPRHTTKPLIRGVPTIKAHAPTLPQVTPTLKTKAKLPDAVKTITTRPKVPTHAAPVSVLPRPGTHPKPGGIAVVAPAKRPAVGAVPRQGLMTQPLAITPVTRLGATTPALKPALTLPNIKTGAPKICTWCKKDNPREMLKPPTVRPSTSPAVVINPTRVSPNMGPAEALGTKRTRLPRIEYGTDDEDPADIFSDTDESDVEESDEDDFSD